MRILILTILSLWGVTTSQAREPEWWQFLGPHGTNRTGSDNLPLKWTDTEGIAWKTAMETL